MKSWRKWAAVAAVALIGSPATAADHSDGSVMGVGGSPAADITDLFAWVQDDNATVTLVMGVVGPVADGVQYVFHVQRGAPAAPTDPVTMAFADNTDIICTVTGGTTECWVGDPAAGGDYVMGDASPDAGLMSDSGMVRVHVNTHADPFFFAGAGFGFAISAANSVAGALTFNEEDYPEEVDDAGTAGLLGMGCGGGADSAGDRLVEMLTGAVVWSEVGGCSPAAGMPVNSFDGANVDAIVIDVDATLFAGTGDILQVWASTHSTN